MDVFVLGSGCLPDLEAPNRIRQPKIGLADHRRDVASPPRSPSCRGISIILIRSDSRLGDYPRVNTDEQELIFKPMRFSKRVSCFSEIARNDSFFWLTNWLGDRQS
jgi:hypothetical protein